MWTRLVTWSVLYHGKGRCPSRFVHSVYVLNTKCYVWDKSNTSLSTTLHIFKHGGGCIILWVCLSSARTTVGCFVRIKRNGIEENLVESAFQQRLGDKFNFQQDNNLKHKAKYTLQLLTKMSLNVPEWSSCGFDLNWLEDLLRDLKMVV